MLFIVPGSFQHTSHRAGWFNALPQSIPKSYSSALYKQRVEMLMVSLLQDQLLLHFVQGWIISFFKELGDQSLKDQLLNFFDPPKNLTCPHVVPMWSFYIRWNTKEDILKNQTVVGHHWHPYSEGNTMEVNGDHQLFDCQHFLEHLILCSTKWFVFKLFKLCLVQS